MNTLVRFNKRESRLAIPKVYSFVTFHFFKTSLLELIHFLNNDNIKRKSNLLFS